jgi:hypothetical protein
MQLSIVTEWNDWLAGVTQPGAGVNDYLGDVPRDPLDAALPAQIGEIVDPYRSDRCAAFDTPATARAIYVLPDGPVVADGTAGPTTRKAKSVAVVARVIVQNSKLAANRRWVDYVLRAIGLSTAAFLDETTAGDNARLRNGIKIVAANRYTYGAWNESVGESTAIAIFGLDFEVRDHVARA